ncbi:MAG: hypothetical protein IT373_14140 [Polyangiaceae bacterium]|nr:hypothetical protein [Polyangiaceae bacterium]
MEWKKAMYENGRPRDEAGRPRRDEHRDVEPGDRRRTTPTKTAYALTERAERTYWTRVGVAYTNKDGSVTVKLDALPVSGVIQIREEPDRRSEA